MEEKDIGVIYLIQKRESVLLKEQVYKIGKTEQDDVNKRTITYDKGSILYYSVRFQETKTIKNIIQVENDLLRIFEEKFKHRPDRGREFFEGDKRKMKEEIDKYYQNLDYAGEEVKEIIQDDHNPAIIEVADYAEILANTNIKSISFADNTFCNGKVIMKDESVIEIKNNPEQVFRQLGVEYKINDKYQRILDGAYVCQCNKKVNNKKVLLGRGCVRQLQIISFKNKSSVKKCLYMAQQVFDFISFKGSAVYEELKTRTGFEYILTQDIVVIDNVFMQNINNSVKLMRSVVNEQLKGTVKKASCPINEFIIILTATDVSCIISFPEKCNNHARVEYSEDFTFRKKLHESLVTDFERLIENIH